MIRTAQTKDIPELIILFNRLLASLEKHGNRLYTQDENRYQGGIMAFISDKMNTSRNIVLVDTNEQDRPKAFIIGWIIFYPEFFNDYILGEIQFMYPMSFATRPLLDAFDAWAQEQGATARASYATPSHEVSWKVMERDGMRRGLHHYYKRYAV